jgi:hypothetical protein
MSLACRSAKQRGHHQAVYKQSDEACPTGAKAQGLLSKLKTSECFLGMDISYAMLVLTEHMANALQCKHKLIVLFYFYKTFQGFPLINCGFLMISMLIFNVLAYQALIIPIF